MGEKEGRELKREGLLIKNVNFQNGGLKERGGGGGGGMVVLYFSK